MCCFNSFRPSSDNDINHFSNDLTFQIPTEMTSLRLPEIVEINVTAEGIFMFDKSIFISRDSYEGLANTFFFSREFDQNTKRIAQTSYLDTGRKMLLCEFKDMVRGWFYTINIEDNNLVKILTKSQLNSLSPITFNIELLN